MVIKLLFSFTDHYIAAHHALLSRNPIGRSSGRRMAPSCPMASASERNGKHMWTKVVSKFSENSVSDKTRENTFGKTRER